MHGTGTSIKSGEVKLVLWVQHVFIIYIDTEKATFCSISDNYINATITGERLTHMTVTCNYVLDVLKLGKSYAEIYSKYCV
jgi:hypothetical protein